MATVGLVCASRPYLNLYAMCLCGTLAVENGTAAVWGVHTRGRGSGSGWRVLWGVQSESRESASLRTARAPVWAFSRRLAGAGAGDLVCMVGIEKAVHDFEKPARSPERPADRGEHTARAP